VRGDHNSPRACMPAQARAQVTTPSQGALALGFIPFAAMCFSVPLWDRVQPMIVGLATAVALMLSQHDPIFGLNAGCVALFLNLSVAVAVSLALAARTPSPRGPYHDPDRSLRFGP